VRKSTWLELLGLSAVVVVGLWAFGVVGGATGGDPAPVVAEAAAGTAGVQEEEGGLGPAEPDDWFIQQRLSGAPDAALDDSKLARAADIARELRRTASS
jgi:hypothetical protein